MKNRILSIILSIAIALQCMPAMAYAYSESPEMPPEYGEDLPDDEALNEEPRFDEYLYENADAYTGEPAGEDADVEAPDVIEESEELPDEEPAYEEAPDEAEYGAQYETEYGTESFEETDDSLLEEAQEEATETDSSMTESDKDISDEADDPELISELPGASNTGKYSDDSAETDSDAVSMIDVEPGDPNVSGDWGQVVMNFLPFLEVLKKLREEEWGKTFNTEPEIQVALLDTSVDTSASVFDGRILEYKSFIQEDQEAAENAISHGTHLAGLIASNTCENVKLLVLPVLQADGTGTADDAARAIHYAVSNGADVINLSLGFSEDYFDNADEYQAFVQVLKPELQYARDHKCVVIASAGNEGKDVDQYKVYPASDENVITVGALSETMEPYKNSNYGDQVDLYAPGENIYSAGTGSTLSGSSVSTAFVSAYCANLLYINRGIDFFSEINNPGERYGVPLLGGQMPVYSDEIAAAVYRENVRFYPRAWFSSYDNSITVKWVPVAPNAVYEVFRSTEGGGFSLIASVSSERKQLEYVYTDLDIEAGKEYSYYIKNTGTALAAESELISCIAAPKEDEKFHFRPIEESMGMGGTVITDENVPMITQYDRYYPLYQLEIPSDAADSFTVDILESNGLKVLYEERERVLWATPDNRQNIPETKIKVKIYKSNGKFDYFELPVMINIPSGDDASGQIGNLEWKLQNNILTISGEGRMPDFDAEIIYGHEEETDPYEAVLANGESVMNYIISVNQNSYSDIAPWVKAADPERGKPFFEEVIIGDGVENISANAFYGCEIESLTGMKGVKQIGDSAFENGVLRCHTSEPDSLDEVFILPDQLKEIGNKAFAYCRFGMPLTGEFFPEGIISIGSYAFKECEFDELYIPGGAEITDFNSIFGSACINSVTVSEDNQYISAENNIVYDKEKTQLLCCTAGAPKKLVLPDALRSIRKFAFSGVDGLEIVLPQGMERIDDWAFADAGIKSVEIPDSVVEIGEGAFCKYRTYHKEDLTYSFSGEGKSYEWIRNIAFDQNDYSRRIDSLNRLKQISIPDSVIEIGDYAFSGMPLESVELPENLNRIGAFVFYQSRMKNIDLPDSINFIGYGAFAESALESVRLPDQLTVICPKAFYACKNLKEVYFPKNLKSFNYITPVNHTGVERLPFGGGTHLQDIYYEGLRSEFLNISDAEMQEDLLNVRFHMNATGKTGDVNWKAEGDFYQERYHDVRLTLYGNGGTADYDSVDQLPWHEVADSITQVTIESGVTHIGSKMFYKHNLLESVTIPATVQTYGKEVFRGAFNTNLCFYFTGNGAQEPLFVEPEYLTAAYRDKIEFKPEIEVKDQEHTLTPGRDYDVTYTSTSKAGEGQIRITFMGDYKSYGNMVLPLIVASSVIEADHPKVITRVTLRNSFKKIPYTGKTIKPDVIVKSGTRRIKSIYYNCYYSGLGKKVGTYTITVKGVSPYIGEESVEYEIIPQDLSKKTARLSKTVYQYDGRACKPTVYISGLYSGIDYTLSYKNNIRPGTAEVTIRGRGNYTGSITKNFTIKKPAERRIGKLLQPMKVKAKKKVFPVKRSKVKKKKQSVSGRKIFEITNAQGNISYYKMGGSSKLSINRATGTITVKKGTKKGTYSITVRVSASGNVRYKAGSRSGRIKIKVK